MPRPTIGRFSLIILALIGAVFADPAGALAEDLKVESAWARASAGRTGAAFVTVFNGSGISDRLVGVQSPVATDAMVHRSFEEDGTMKMEHVVAVDVGAGQRVEMKPGGLHIMLVGLKQPLRKGDQFPLSLRFEHGGVTDLSVKIHGPGAMAPE